MEGRCVMAVKLEKVVPFGRSLAEYQGMFSLSDEDLNKSIVGIGDGPASFNAEMTASGKSVVSVDPLYAFRPEEIEQQFYSVVDNVIALVKASPDDYNISPEEIREKRVNALRHFIAEFEIGKAQGRYVVGELPDMDFRDGQFELALSSNLLFLYSAHFTYEFHRGAVLEMLRIASEVRIYPLLTLMLEPSSYLQPIIDELKFLGFQVSLEKVSYEVQKGCNEMLRIRNPVLA